MKHFNNIYKLSLFTFLLFLSTNNIITQNLRFDHITTEDGISSNSINCIFQDRKGFIWIGTADGLNKYDGRKFTIYRNDPYDSTSISDNTIYNILEDKDGFLWISTHKGGLNKFDRNNELFTHFIHDPNNPNSISYNSISAICIDTANDIWISTDIQLEKYNKTLNKFIKKEGRSAYYNSMIVGNDGNIWYLNGFLQKFDTRKDTIKTFVQKYSSKLSIFEDKEGIIWSGDNGELNSFNKYTEKFMCFKIPKKRFHESGIYRLRSISESENDILWLGTWGGGLFQFNKKTGRFRNFKYDPTDPNSLSNDNVYSTLVDKTGTLWVGTYGGGINKYSDFSNKFNQIIYNPLNKMGLNDPFIFPLIEDNEGKLFIGTFNGGLNIFDSRKGYFKYFLNKSDKNPGWSNSITCLLIDQNNLLWIGTTEGMFIFNKNDGSIRHFKNFIINPYSKSSAKYSILSEISIIYKDRENILWIGAHQSGLVQYNSRLNEIKQYIPDPGDPASINDTEVKSIFEDKKGALWIGTLNGGLNKFDRKTGQFFHYINNPNDLNSISHNFIKTVFEDSHGILWVGTAGGGLNKLVRDKTDNFDTRNEIFEHYTHKDGLANDVIYGILEDNEGNLWISTNNGLSKFNPLSKTFRNYDVSDGLINNEFNTLSFFKNKSGEMFFGSMGGIIYFDPQKIKDNPYLPAIVITSLKIFDNEIKKDIFKDDEIYLSYDENFVYFEFAALDYTNPKKNQYTYKLEGVDKVWINCGNRARAGYPNLSSGEYIFKVNGSNNDGIWNKSGISFKIIVSPPPWKTWWAYCIYLLLFLGIFFAFFLYKTKQHKHQINNLKEQSRSIIKSQEDERKRISRELHDGINQKLSIANLNLNAFEEKYKNEIKNEISEAKLHINEVINEIRNISHNLHPVELDDLGIIKSIFIYCNKFEKRTNISVKLETQNIPVHLPSQIEINLYRMIQEAFTNIEKHSQATIVNLDISLLDSIIYTSIKDNGIGFEVSNISDNSEKIHYGLKNIRERTYLLNGTFEIKSIQDKGTCISIMIPFKEGINIDDKNKIIDR